MENLEYLLGQTRRAEEMLTEVDTVAKRLVEAPSRVIESDLCRADVGLAGARDALKAIDHARYATQSRLSQLIAELQGLHDVLDDAIGKVGRLV